MTNEVTGPARRMVFTGTPGTANDADSAGVLGVYALRTSATTVDLS